MGEAHKARCGGGAELPCPLQVLTNPEALQTPSFRGFMEPSFHRHD